MSSSHATDDRPEQLALLSAGAVPAQFRLDDATRRRGLAHVAAIRAQLQRASESRAAPARRTFGRAA